MTAAPTHDPHAAPPTAPDPPPSAAPADSNLPPTDPDSDSDSDSASDSDFDPPSIIALANSFVAERFAQHDPSHDMHHVRRVVLLALRLTRCPSLPRSDAEDSHRAPRVDLLVTELAALFHDLCDAKYTSTASPAAAVTARTVLAPFWAACAALAQRAGESLDQSITPQQRETVERIVDNVSWSKDEARRRARASASTSTSTSASADASESASASAGAGEGAADAQSAWESHCAEFQCVSDADRLDAIGSIGILRCAAYSAIKSRPLHVPPANEALDSRPPAEQGEGYNGSCVAHFHEKLLRIRGERLWTEAAREEAERRQGVMEYFLAELDLEWAVAARGAELSLLRGLA